jgi:hypothetical protein
VLFWQKGQPVAPVLPPQCLGNGGNCPRCPRGSSAPAVNSSQACLIFTMPKIDKYILNNSGKDGFWGSVLLENKRFFHDS